MATPLDVDSSLTGQAVKTRQAMVFNEISLDQGAKHIPGTPLESDERLIAAPFIFGEDILGVMTHNRVGEPFSPEELALARTFADYAAVALHNAHLFGEMQNALDALQRSEVRYRDLFENAASAIYVHDLDGNILDANPMAVERMGYTLEELLAKNLHDFIAPASAAPEVREHAYLVTEHPGGRGAVREAIEFILKAQERWSELTERYYSQ